MKHFRSASKLSVLSSSALLSLVLAASAQAQTDYYFDPGMSASGTGSGGTGTFGTNTPTDFYLPGSGDVGFPPGAVANANFDGVGGMVTVSGSVDPANIYSDGSSPYTITADATGSVDLGNAEHFNIGESGAGLTFNAPIAFTGVGGDNTFNDSGAISLSVSNTGSGAFVFGSTVTNTPEAGGTGNPQFFQLLATQGTVEFAGDIKGANTGYDPASGSATNDNITVNSGATVLVDNNNFDRFQIAGGSLLINTAGLVLNQNNGFSYSNGTLGTVAGGDTGFTSTIANYGGTQTLEAGVAGGRITFSGDIQAGGVNNHREVIAGPGIVELSNPNGNDYAVRYNDTTVGDSNSDVGTEINPGATLLISNTSGSATGSAGQVQNIQQNFDSNGNEIEGGPSTGLNNVVQLDPTATLAGTGYTQQQVVTSNAVNSQDFSTQTHVSGTGIISPGALSDGKVSSIGTLHLDNGLDATNGLTVNFDLAGTTSDQINVGRSQYLSYDHLRPVNGAPTYALVLNGAVTTFNFASSTAIVAGQTDTLIYGGNTYIDNGTGYFDQIGNGNGWDLTNLNEITSTGIDGFTAMYQDVTVSGVEELNVTFEPAAVPEPSTWALMGLAGLVLIGSGKLRKRRI